ncbi:cAMP-activated global transcriptional regulator CRP [Saccharobesus litoralis]|uniref:cAMP-activated global transcriptional regulator CRP n=1 Tax=Saccharobesus litoralis TaxID=2172099 RepID=A0A2S0VQN0_9ALTE|nr:cAMP-activated global transcriptional regulator CRP [Saccharobesus litoralis]AWB66521.1 cAMP-activated global transcriptional regulator CRP [Saccharobesus litoralis]
MPVPFSLATDEELNKFVSFCTRRVFPAKHIIIREGDQPETLHLLLRGSVSVTTESDQGRELVLAYLNPGEFYGELGLFDGGSRSACVTARTECEVAEIGYAKFKQICMENPQILFRVSSQLALKLRDTSRKVVDLAFLDVTGRVARALLELAQKPDAMTHPEGMQIKITRQELGRIVGCSREMVGRVLKELETQGLVEAHGKTMVIHGAR